MLRRLPRLLALAALAAAAACDAAPSGPTSRVKPLADLPRAAPEDVEPDLPAAPALVLDEAAPCGPLTLAGRADLAAFAASGCESVAGDLVLDGAGLGSLAGLERLRVVDGDLVVQEAPALRDLAALAGLRVVGGSLLVAGNPRLHDLSGLSALRWVGGDVWVADNPALESVAGLGGLLHVGGDVVVEGNPQLAWGAAERLVGLAPTRRAQDAGGSSLDDRR